MTAAMPYRRVLVPVDDGATAATGLASAIELASALGTRLRVLHVLDPRLLIVRAATGVPPEQLVEEQRAAGTRLLDDALALADRAGVDAEAALRQNPPLRVSDLILAEAADWPADLIVMGTHGRHGVARLALGSNAEAVLRASPVPVMLVREQHRSSP
jgi:nucleotide-binding universal stress UspA family protein